MITVEPVTLLEGRSNSISETFTCAREGCDNQGVKTTHNQKYCSSDCCRIATNAKIMKKYHERVAIKRGKKRVCQCGTALSRYNENKICGPCEMKNKQAYKGEAANILASVIWLT